MSPSTVAQYEFERKRVRKVVKRTAGHKNIMHNAFYLYCNTLRSCKPKLGCGYQNKTIPHARSLSPIAKSFLVYLSFEWLLFDMI